jgi:hypothetical protein
MTDLLLKFPHVDTAGKIGEALGCAEKVDGQWVFGTTHKVSICAIGEHYLPTGKTIKSDLGDNPEMQSDGNFWALVRIADGIETPEQLTPFLVTKDPSNITQPQHAWA